MTRNERARRTRRRWAVMLALAAAALACALWMMGR